MKYGVLRGRPDRYQREDGEKSPHLQVRVVDDGGQPWRIAVNVESSDGSEVVFWVVDPILGHPIVATLAANPSGFTSLAGRTAQSLDFVKAPIFDFLQGRVLPPSGSASGDDLQDLLSLYLDQCKKAGGEIYAFGAKFEQNLHKPIDKEFGNLDGLHGIHDIHMNQGNVDSHKKDNGAFHDGGMILAFPDRCVGLFLAFQTQCIPTDTKGNAAGSAKSLGSMLRKEPAPPPPPPPPQPPVYIERALLNPLGDDAGREVVVLANLATHDASLAGWTLSDRNGRKTLINLTIGAGQSVLINLDGEGVQLGNHGGNLVLRDEQDVQIDAVTYSSVDAAREAQYVRFRR